MWMGVFIWLCVTDLEGNPRTIVTFDLGAMTLGDEIPPPDSVIDCGRWCMSDLGVLGGKLCVMSRCVKHYECNVWVRDDRDSWVKHHLYMQKSFTLFNILTYFFFPKPSWWHL